MTPTQLQLQVFCVLPMLVVATPAVNAQSIIPAVDGTATIVTVNNQQFNISGGTLSGDGANLFHSFERFGLNSGEMATFLSQPGIRNVLSRVVGGEASIIDGQIQLLGGSSNLFLINPTGIVFGSNARLNLPASFTATTADRVGLEGGWFYATGANDYASLVGAPNRFAFSASQPGSIVNAGDLSVPSGNHITLLGGSSINTGSLSAPGGTITVAAVPGQKMVRISQEGMVLNLELEALDEGAATQMNQETENALGNDAAIAPLSLPELLTQSNLGHATGLILDANGILRLTGSGLALPTAPGSTTIAGTLDTAAIASSETAPPLTGGAINILGEKIGLFNATVDASGRNGGGTVRLGGNYQGQGTLPRAQQTLISDDSTISANALERGNGGQVIVWADQLARFYGHISAQGGAEAGDGGSIEVSGKELLIFGGTADASATRGNPGQLLLDPKNITISDTNSPLATFLNPNPGTPDAFGNAIAGLGNNILIGAPGDLGTVGAAYLFDGNTGGLLQTFSNPNPSAGDSFGISVAAVGNNALIGAPLEDLSGPFASGAAYLFDSNTGSLLQTLTSPGFSPFGFFGISVAGVGNNALVGARGEGLGGRAYLFDAGSGAAITTFNNPNLTAGDQFGSAVAGVGNNVLIGAPGTMGNVGAAYLFDANNGTTPLQTFANPTPAANDQFGNAVAGVGNNALVGAFNDNTAGNNAGAAYLFNSNTGELLQTFLSPNANPGDEFGTSVAGVGSKALIGARSDNTVGTDTGAAYLFDSSTGGLLQSFFNPTPETGDQFGQSVGAVGSNALVGANQDNTGASNSGAVYAFPTSFTFSDNPDQSITIAASTLTNITNTGTSVVLQASNDITVNQAIATNNAGGNGGGLKFQAGRSLLLNADIDTDNGDLTLIANETTARGVVDAFRDPGNATISAAPGVSLNAGSGSLQVILSTGTGLTNNGSGDITLGNLVAGNVQLENNGPGGGSVTTGDIATNGGSIAISASDRITTGRLDSSGADNGGGVVLNSANDIQVSSINAQGGAEGMGGTVEIVSGRFVRVTDMFTDREGILASISTAGGMGGGEIIIQHGGDGVIPFIVGDAALNGTAGAITSGETTISPFRVFPFTHQEDNIQIISVDEPFEIDPDLDPPRIPPHFPIEAPLSDVDLDFSEQEDRFANEFATHLGVDEPTPATVADIRKVLRRIEQATGIKPAIIYAFFTPRILSLNDSGLVSSQEPAIANSNLPFRDNDRLELMLVTAEGAVVRRVVPGTTRKKVLQEVDDLLIEVTDRKKLETATYLSPAQQMYRRLVAPLEEDLQAREIDNLVFILDRGLRSVPLAAMHDGEGFIVERYSVGLMPSFSLTDTRYVDVRDLQVLAMGAEEFTQRDPLIAVPTELSILTEQLWQGQSFLNQAFTANRVTAARKARPFGILHLATHADFRPGAIDKSYIQFWDDEQISLKQLRQLGLNDPPIELLVLSACRTAVSDPEAELGFAGLAVIAGVKSALGSLWYVSDAGTLGLMTSFYQQLRAAPIKAEALRQAQLATIRGEVRLEAGALAIGEERFPLPETLVQLGDRHFMHPYYWSGFTMVGNPW